MVFLLMVIILFMIEGMLLFLWKMLTMLGIIGSDVRLG